MYIAPNCHVSTQTEPTNNFIASMDPESLMHKIRQCQSEDRDISTVKTFSGTQHQTESWWDFQFSAPNETLSLAIHPFLHGRWHIISYKDGLWSHDGTSPARRAIQHGSRCLEYIPSSSRTCNFGVHDRENGQTLLLAKHESGHYNFRQHMRYLSGNEFLSRVHQPDRINHDPQSKMQFVP